MPEPRFNIRQLVRVPEDVCASKLGSIVQVEYQPPVHNTICSTDSEILRDDIDCSGYVYRISLHGGRTKMVSEKQLLAWNPSRVEKLQTPSPPLTEF